MFYNLYRYIGEPVTKISPYRLPGRSELKRFHPGGKKLISHRGIPIFDISVYMEAKGKYRILYVKDEDNKIVHYSYVLPALKRFSFAKKGDLVITQTWTSKEYRHNKIFAFVLMYALKRYGSEERNVFVLYGENKGYLKNELEEVQFQLYKKVSKQIFGKFKVLR